MARVNRYILLVNKQSPSLTVAEKLEEARRLNIAERELDSTNTIGRDADYYFAARSQVAASSNKAEKIGKAIGGNVAWAFYGALKIGAAAVGHDEWTRTDPDKPNAPVGGAGWMNLGSEDGMTDVGDRVGDVLPHSSASGNSQSEPAPSGLRRGST